MDRAKLVEPMLKNVGNRKAFFFSKVEIMQIRFGAFPRRKIDLLLGSSAIACSKWLLFDSKALGTGVTGNGSPNLATARSSRMCTSPT